MKFAHVVLAVISLCGCFFWSSVSLCQGVNRHCHPETNIECCPPLNCQEMEDDSAWRICTSEPPLPCLRYGEGCYFTERCCGDMECRFFKHYGKCRQKCKTEGKRCFRDWDCCKPFKCNQLKKNEFPQCTTKPNYYNNNYNNIASPLLLFIAFVMTYVFIN
ncbi:hypothetical protein BsWGS_22067 [Bradybaena similaris]